MRRGHHAGGVQLTAVAIGACVLGLPAFGIPQCLAASPGQGGEPSFTALVAQPVVTPRPVLGADGKRHLTYELSLVNDATLLAQVEAVSALDADTGAVLARWEGEALAAILRINGREPGVTLARSHSAFMFLDVALPPDAPVPRLLRHRISVTRLQQAPGDDEHKGVPLDPAAAIPGQVTFVGASTPVEAAAPVLLQPPLRGAGWVAFNGCCAEVTSHRGAVMAFDGKALAPERFAIDIVKVDGEGRMFAGPADQASSYGAFGQPVHAAAAGTVVEASDGAPEQVPERVRALALDAYVGNHVVIDMGGGDHALYAHLKTGTVAVRAGDRIEAGQVIGEVGNTGNSDAPHLHFHVMNAPWPLAASGLPFALDRFTGVGRYEPTEDSFTKGTPGNIDRAWFPGRHAGELPLDREVVDFGDR